jgi:hypothetical protein
MMEYQLRLRTLWRTPSQHGAKLSLNQLRRRVSIAERDEFLPEHPA